LKNFGNHLRLLTQTYLERTLDNRYQSDNWNFLTRLQQFQILDERYFTGTMTPMIGCRNCCSMVIGCTPAPVWNSA